MGKRLTQKEVRNITPGTMEAHASNVITPASQLEKTIQVDFNTGKINGNEQRPFRIHEIMEKAPNGFWYGKNHALLPLSIDNSYRGLVHLYGQKCPDIIGWLVKNKIEYVINPDNEENPGMMSINGKPLSHNVLEINHSDDSGANLIGTNPSAKVNSAREMYPAKDYLAIFIPESPQLLHNMKDIYDFDKDGFYVTTTSVRYADDFDVGFQKPVIAASEPRVVEFDPIITEQIREILEDNSLSGEDD